MLMCINNVLPEPVAFQNANLLRFSKVKGCAIKRSFAFFFPALAWACFRLNSFTNSFKSANNLTLLLKYLSKYTSVNNKERYWKYFQVICSSRFSEICLV